MYLIILILILIVVFTIYYIYFNNDDKDTIEGFDSNDPQYKNYLNAYTSTSNNVHRYTSLIPSLNDIQSTLQATIKTQNSEFNLQAQKYSAQVECIYNAIIKFLYDNSLNIDDGGNTMYDNLSNAKNGLYSYMDSQLAQLTNINSTNLQNLANSKNQLNSLNQQLAKMPAPDPTQMNNLKNQINSEFNIITQMQQPQGASDTYISGLFFKVVDGYFNDDTAYFIHANPRSTTATVASSNKNGYTYNFSSGIITALTTANGSQLSNDSFPQQFSVEWVGYFYTKSDSPTGTPENWQFHIASDDSAYLWIGDSAKGNGNDIINYNVGNATVNNGGEHSYGSTQNWIKPIQLQANTYYPIRIQYGNDKGPGDMKINIINNGQNSSGGNEISNAINYFFSNGKNPIDNSDISPTYVSGGLYFTLYNGYFGDTNCVINYNSSCGNTKCDKDNTNFFVNNTNYYTLGANSMVLTDGPSTGYTNSIADISVGTRTVVNGNTYSVFLEWSNALWHHYSVEWIGFFYSKSSSTSTNTESWTFSISSDDASYLWIGDNAKGNGQAPVNYTPSNATINDGGLHGNSKATKTIQLMPNEYYPIRIQFGENDGAYNMNFTFTPPGGNPTTDGTGYFFSNKFNKLDNTGGFDDNKYNQLLQNYTNDETSYLTLQNYYNVAYTNYQNLLSQIANTQGQIDKYLAIANESTAQLMNATNFVVLVKKGVDTDFSSLQFIFDTIKQVTKYSYKDIYGKVYMGLYAYVVQARETCAKVISVEKSNNYTCKSNAVDGDKQKMNSFYYDGYCYYTRPDSKLANIVNHGSKNNVTQLDQEGGFKFTCNYTMPNH